MAYKQPQFRRLVSAAPIRRINTPIVLGLGETAEETIARLDRENVIAKTQEYATGSTALTDAELAKIQRQEAEAMRKMEKEMKQAMIEQIAKQVAFSIALNTIPGVGAVLDLVLGAVTKKSGAHYQRKAERYVRDVQISIDTYKKSREQLVNDAIGRVYDQEYKGAEAAAISLVTKKVMAIQIEGLDGFGSFLKKTFSSIVKTIKDPTRLITKPIDEIKSFVDDMSGKSSYTNAVKAANEQRTKSKAEIKLLTDAQIREVQSPTARGLMRDNIIEALIKSPAFQRLAQLMLQTRRDRLAASKRKGLGTKLAIGAGVAVVALVVAKAF